MTRINLGVRVNLLTDEHLLAEHREIKRLPTLYKERASKTTIASKAPDKFTLGRGHVLFFIDKPNITLSRYKDIHSECIKRGFNVQDYSEKWECYEQSLFNNTLLVEPMDRVIIEQRIIQRIKESKKKSWHYYGQAINPQKAIDILLD